MITYAEYLRLDMNRETVVWFWYKSDDKYDIYSGNIYNWNIISMKEPIALIRVHNKPGTIYLSKDRIFQSKMECEAELRDKLLNEILN